MEINLNSDSENFEFYSQPYSYQRHMIFCVVQDTLKLPGLLCEKWTVSFSDCRIRGGYIEGRIQSRGLHSVRLGHNHKGYTRYGMDRVTRTTAAMGWIESHELHRLWDAYNHIDAVPWAILVRVWIQSHGLHQLWDGYSHINYTIYKMDAATWTTLGMGWIQSHELHQLWNGSSHMNYAGYGIHTVTWTIPAMGRMQSHVQHPLWDGYSHMNSSDEEGIKSHDL